MTTKKKDAELSSSVTVAFFGLLLALSLILNIGIFLKLDDARTENGSISRLAAEQIDGSSLKKIKKDGRIWVELPDPIFDAYFLTDETCSTCVDISQMKNDFEVTYPTADVHIVDVHSPSGKKLIDAGVSVVPAIVLSKVFQNTTRFAEAVQVGVVAPVGDSYYEFRTSGNKKILTQDKLPESMRGEGPLRIVGYTDFFSPDSAAFSTFVPQIAAQFANNIQVKNNAFVTDAPSALVAEAVQCGVPMQKIINTRDQYIAFISEVSNGKQALAPEDLDTLSGKLKTLLSLEGDTAECFEKRQYFDEVQRIAQEAQSLGITGAPAFFIGNRFLAGPQSEEVFAETIQDVLREMGVDVPEVPAVKEEAPNAGAGVPIELEILEEIKNEE